MRHPKIGLGVNLDGGEGAEGTVGRREGVFCQVIRIKVNFYGYICISFMYGCC